METKIVYIPWHNNFRFLSTTICLKLQALVYNILPPTTAIADSATGLEKLPANKQFFLGAQKAVSL